MIQLKIYGLCLFCCLASLSKAQYIPKKQRFKKNWVRKIEIPKEGQFVVKRASIYCDTLIMHDHSTLKVESMKEFSMFANFVKIGEKCLIDAQGKPGKKLATLQFYPKTYGYPGKKISLNFNIYQMGSLTINTNGGKAGKSIYKRVEVMGVGGSGGDILFQYYAPFTIVRKKRSRKKSNIWFNTNVGKMESAMNQYTRLPGDIRKQTRAMERHAGINDRLRRRIEMEVNSRKSGKVVMKRLPTPISKGRE